MPRALTIPRTFGPSAARARSRARARQRAAYYAKANCRFWIFEEAALPGAFIEFTEAKDKSTLSAAHADAPDKPLDAKRIYQEVELKE